MKTPPLLRELTWAEAEAETAEALRALSAAERVRLVAELTRAAWQGLGRERERFCRVYSYPQPTSSAVPGDRGVRHGPSRARASDVDVLVATDERNVERIRSATREFVGVEPSASALRPPRGMFRIGSPSAHVDVTTKVDGIADFERAWQGRSKGEFFGVSVAFLSLKDMLRTKRAARRPKDLGDIVWLVEEIARRAHVRPPCAPGTRRRRAKS